MDRPLQLVIQRDQDGYVESVEATGAADDICDMLETLVTGLELATRINMIPLVMNHVVAYNIVMIAALIDALPQEDVRRTDYIRALRRWARSTHRYMEEQRTLFDNAREHHDPNAGEAGGHYGRLYFRYQWRKHINPEFPALPST